MAHRTIKAMTQTSAPDPWAVGWAIRILTLVAFFTAFAVPIGRLQIIPAVIHEEIAGTPEPGPLVIPLIAVKTPTPVATAPAVTPTPHIPRIGIIAGHSGNDSGAICPDGLQEVTINTDVARRVATLLTQRGWEVDLLEEFDVRLNGYVADALISIHADSCNVPGKSGFKVARAESSYQLEPEDRLVKCLSDSYQKNTHLIFDPYTITYDMTRYHAYYEIDRRTPAAVIEIGFMLDDRELLTQHPEKVALGIAEGIVCYVENASQ
ncbi:MAG: N-acetylmuramoyl-L-alanine amidase [Anaerolineae bacterium]|nr:N-acetylmuramoyl-L-alanine amidase [Anaerolineae bacterium]